MEVFSKDCWSNVGVSSSGWVAKSRKKSQKREKTEKKKERGKIRREQQKTKNNEKMNLNSFSSLIFFKLRSMKIIVCVIFILPSTIMIFFLLSIWSKQNFQFLKGQLWNMDQRWGNQPCIAILFVLPFAGWFEFFVYF